MVSHDLGVRFGSSLVQKSVLGNLDRLAGLAGLANHTGLDIRPTLLRVLTDLYVQKPSHSPEEERHYVELALRLIEDVDAGTCAAVATSLARYPAAPAEVVQRLAPIAALGYPKAHSNPAAAPAVTARAMPAKILPDDDDSDLFEPAIPEPDMPAKILPDDDDSDLFEPAIPEPDIFEPDIFEPLPEPAPAIVPASAPLATAEPTNFVELRETFFEADAPTRRLILLSLDAIATKDMPALASGTNIMRYLEQSALAGRRQEFTTLLQQSLRVSRALATRIVSDETGEPFLVAGRALAMPSDVFQRILMFLNPDIGQSVDRVYELADLFFELPQDCALHLVAIWREADRAEARASLHRPVHWPDGDKSVRREAASERKPASDQKSTPGSTQRRA
jgi:hypothetical protein